jgi:uncharacterized protein (DUF1778 family)
VLVQRMYTAQQSMDAKPGETRDQRWALRVAESEDALVRAASSVEETSLTSFIRAAAISEARRVLADRTRFELDQPAWDEFMELLDRPAKVPPGLRKLFSKPSVFE